MLSITRMLARTLRATFRKAGDSESRAKPSSVIFRADDTGLRIQTRAGAVGLEYRMDGTFPAVSFVVPFDVLTDVEGTTPTPVQFFVEPKGSVRAEWTDAGVPQRRQYAPAKDGGTWLESPETYQNVGDGSTLAAITDAMQSAAQQRVRFALNCIQLRGSKGEAAGTDGHQLLIVRGLRFPFEDDVLVPRTRFFEGKAFTDADVVEMARTDDHVVVRVGPWTAWLTIDKASRFPDVRSVIPRESKDSTRIVLAEEDAEFLIRSLPRLPDADGQNSPVTVHVNGQVIVRAKSESAPLTELILSRSRAQGPEVRIAVDRTFLKRAAQLGIRNLRFANDHTPVVGESDRHLYVWQPLHPSVALPPSENALRIDSAAALDENPVETSVPSPLARNDPPMNDKPTNRNEEHDAETTDDVVSDPIQEADALRNQLRDVLGRVNRLVHALKRQRRQAQLVRSTLASLKQLQEVA